MQPFLEYLLKLWGTWINLLAAKLGLGHSLQPSIHSQLLPQVLSFEFFWCEGCWDFLGVCLILGFFLLCFVNQSLAAPLLPLLLCWYSAFSQALGQLAHTDQAGTKTPLESLVLGVCICKTWLYQTASGYGCSQHRIMYELRNSTVSPGCGFATLAFFFFSKEKIFLLYFQRWAFPKLWTQELAKY